MGGQTNGQTDRPTDIQMYCTVSLEMDRYMDTNIKDTQPASQPHTDTGGMTEYVQEDTV